MKKRKSIKVKHYKQGTATKLKVKSIRSLGLVAYMTAQLRKWENSNVEKVST